MTDRQQQNIIAFLELARTAIDNAELRIVGLPDSNTPILSALKTISQVEAAATNLFNARDLIKYYADSIPERPKDASTTNGVAAGNTVVP